jgi:hypothetical protein
MIGVICIRVIWDRSAIPLPLNDSILYMWVPNLVFRADVKG